jgi:hypothetical protein
MTGKRKRACRTGKPRLQRKKARTVGAVPGLNEIAMRVDKTALRAMLEDVVSGAANMGADAGFMLTLPSAAKSEDCEWFASHPQRSMRVRPLRADELELWPSGADAVLVRQYSPGSRMRLPFLVRGCPIVDEEACCQALSLCLARGGATPNEFMRTWGAFKQQAERPTQ